MWSLEQRVFTPLKQMNTTEPCKSALFRPHSLLLATDKVLEVDLKDFTVEGKEKWLFHIKIQLSKNLRGGGEFLSE